MLTGRAKRLLGVALLPSALLALAAVVVAAIGIATASLAVSLALGLLLLAGAPWTLFAANVALEPLQNAINRRYAQRARRSLRESDPLVVGITGSYGKTTTKFCVGAVLAADRPTLVTPESFNSFLGVIRTVNEHLLASHRAFVVEMGMFRSGDIAELCELVHPTIGVITAIGPMHLERLGSIEAIAAAKGELLDALPPRATLSPTPRIPSAWSSPRAQPSPSRCSGSTIPRARSQRRHTAPAPRRARPTHPKKARPTCRSSQVTSPSPTVAPPFNSSSDGPDSAQVEVSAELLGRHNVLNLLAAAAVGSALDIDPTRIAAGLSQVKAPAHRLQPIHNPRAGVVVIDDAYNSNPDGAGSALEVLREHPATRRLLVTPGMVELGELEAELNRRFGEHAGQVCDLVILVGPARTSPIARGARGLWHGPIRRPRRARHRGGHHPARPPHSLRRCRLVRERSPRHLCGTGRRPARRRLSRD